MDKSGAAYVKQNKKYHNSLEVYLQFYKTFDMSQRHVRSFGFVQFSLMRVERVWAHAVYEPVDP